jgi:AcrR family transcriptional regulator
MARKRKRKQATRPTPSGDGSSRERIVAAFMALLAEKPIERIDLSEVAKRARVSLAELREQFDSPLAILAAHVQEIDRQVLAGVDADLEDEPARERLFDVLMRRLEALAPHKAAVRSLMRSTLCNPGLAFALNGMGVRSHQWMLTAAGISASGPKGAVRAQGLALLFATVLRTWVEDDDPGLARTMAALDRALASGQRWSGFLDDLCSIPEAVSRRRRGRGRRNAADRAAA